jgi:uncharacterized protein
MTAMPDNAAARLGAVLLLTCFVSLVALWPVSSLFGLWVREHVAVVPAQTTFALGHGRVLLTLLLAGVAGVAASAVRARLGKRAVGLGWLVWAAAAVAYGWALRSAIAGDDRLKFQPHSRTEGAPAMNNPALYFEIPVLDMRRAMMFYERVFGFDFQLEEIHGNEMALLPFDMNGAGVSGSLARGEIYQPSLSGTLIYLRTEDVEETLKRAQAAGAKILFPKTKASEYSFVAEIQDSEGNRIGLMQSLR